MLKGGKRLRSNTDTIGSLSTTQAHAGMGTHCLLVLWDGVLRRSSCAENYRPVSRAR